MAALVTFLVIPPRTNAAWTATESNFQMQPLRVGAEPTTIRACPTILHVLLVGSGVEVKDEKDGAMARYKFGDVETNKHLQLEYGNVTKTFKMDYVSNSEFSQVCGVTIHAHVCNLGWLETACTRCGI